MMRLIDPFVGLHVFARGGRPRSRQTNVIRIAQLNPTSVQRHFDQINMLDAELVMLVETKASELDQLLVTRRAHAAGFQVLWGEHVGKAGAALGRSGGVAILARQGWRISESELGLELAVKPHNCLTCRACSKDGQQDLILIAYCGHPEYQADTEQDLYRLQLWAATCHLPVVMGIDSNIDDTDDFKLPHSVELQDAALMAHYRFDKPLQPTNIGHTVHRGSIDVPVSQKIWSMLTRAATPLANWYGTPQLAADHCTPNDVAQTVLLSGQDAESPTGA